MKIFIPQSINNNYGILHSPMVSCLISTYQEMGHCCGFNFTSSNKSLLLFVALRKLCRDSVKMNFKLSQNCWRVKLVALGESGWESCSWGCCSHRGTQGRKCPSICLISQYIFFISKPVDYKFINTIRMLCC